MTLSAPSATALHFASMLAIATDSTSTHAHARPKTRVGVFEQCHAPRTRARATPSRETRWGNSAEVRRSTSGLSQYLSPEPMLQDPDWVKGQAQEGFSAPTYAYARNNPVHYVDPDGKNPGTAAGAGIGTFVAPGPGTIIGAVVGTAIVGAAAWWALSPSATTTTTMNTDRPAPGVGPVCGPKTLEEFCAIKKGQFIERCIMDCTLRGHDYQTCKLACRPEGEEIRKACIRANGG